MQPLLTEIRACTICRDHLPYEPRPVLSAAAGSRIAIIGQAPGSKVHASGIPWDDASGRTLRTWLGVSDDQFYDSDLFAIIPMGFCYPGKGSSGDLPPRPECAPQWHPLLLSHLKNLKLTLLIGRYAQLEYLAEKARSTLTENVEHFEDYLPAFLPLPHPSPRNRIWLKRNPWFEQRVLPVLQHRIKEIIH